MDSVIELVIIVVKLGSLVTTSDKYPSTGDTKHRHEDYGIPGGKMMEHPSLGGMFLESDYWLCRTQLRATASESCQ